MPKTEFLVKSGSKTRERRCALCATIFTEGAGSAADYLLVRPSSIPEFDVQVTGVYECGVITAKLLLGIEKRNTPGIHMKATIPEDTEEKMR